MKQLYFPGVYLLGRSLIPCKNCRSIVTNILGQLAGRMRRVAHAQKYSYIYLQARSQVLVAVRSRLCDIFDRLSLSSSIELRPIMSLDGDSVTGSSSGALASVSTVAGSQTPTTSTATAIVTTSASSEPAPLLSAVRLAVQEEIQAALSRSGLQSRPAASGIVPSTSASSSTTVSSAASEGESRSTIA